MRAAVIAIVRYGQAVRLERAGKLEESARGYEAAINLMRGSRGSSGTRLVSSLSRLDTIERQGGQHQRTASLLQEALDLLDQGRTWSKKAACSYQLLSVPRALQTTEILIGCCLAERFRGAGLSAKLAGNLPE